MAIRSVLLLLLLVVILLAVLALAASVTLGLLGDLDADLLVVATLEHFLGVCVAKKKGELWVPLRKSGERVTYSTSCACYPSPSLRSNLRWPNPCPCS